MKHQKSGLIMRIFLFIYFYWLWVTCVNNMPTLYMHAVNYTKTSQKMWLVGFIWLGNKRSLQVYMFSSRRQRTAPQLPWSWSCCSCLYRCSTRCSESTPKEEADSQGFQFFHWGLWSFPCNFPQCQIKQKLGWNFSVSGHFQTLYGHKQTVVSAWNFVTINIPLN